MHYAPCIPYSEHPKELGELNQEYADYITGDLVLDWDEIRAEVEQQWKDYEESERSREPQEVTELFENN